jgi:DNA-binding NtrC family response regulator
VGGKTILVVDDDKGVLSVAETVLARAGYSVISVSNPLVALRRSREFEGEIHLLLTDVAMPEMDGVQLARQIQAERPQTRVLLMSGYMASASRFPLLNKPFAFSDLVDRVAGVIAATPPPPEISAGDEATRNARLDEARKKFLDSSREFTE